MLAGQPPFDPKQTSFWILFTVITIVGLVPTFAGILFFGLCYLGNCATDGSAKDIVEYSLRYTDVIVLRIGTHIGPTFQFIAPILSVGMAALAGAATGANETATPEQTRLRKIKWCWIVGFFLIACITGVIYIYYRPAPEADLETKAMQNLLGDTRVFEFIAEANIKAFQMAASNFFVLIGLSTLEEFKTD